MSDDIRIVFKGDLTDITRKEKKVRKLLNRFTNANKKASNRRVKIQKSESDAVNRAIEREAARTLRMERRLSRKRARNRLRAMKANIRVEKQEARARERILRAHERRRGAIMRGFGRFGGRALGLLGIGGVAGLIFKGREILKFDEQLARSAVQAKITTKQQMKLRKAITDTSIEYGVQRNVLLETVATIVDLSGDINLATEGLGRFSQIIRGTGADASELGRFAVSLKAAFGDITTTELFDKMEILIAQGDKAKVNIAAMATEGEKLFSAFRGKGFAGEKSFIEFGAFIQLAARSGDIAEGATAVTRFLDSLIKRKTQLGEKGVAIFGKDKEMRDFGDIIKDILKVTGGDIIKLKELFPNIRALKAIELMGIEYKRSGGEFKNLTELVEVGYNAQGESLRKYQRVAKTASQGFERMSAALTMLADEALVGVMNDLAEAMSKIIGDPKGLQDLRDTFKIIGDTMRYVFKILSLTKYPFKYVGAMAEDLATGYGNILRIKQKVAPSAIDKAIAANKELGFGGRYEKEAFEDMIFNVNFQTLIDESGNILKEDATLKAQIDSDRGSKSRELSVSKRRGGTTGSF